MLSLSGPADTRSAPAVPDLVASARRPVRLAPGGGALLAAASAAFGAAAYLGSPFEPPAWLVAVSAVTLATLAVWARVTRKPWALVSVCACFAALGLARADWRAEAARTPVIAAPNAFVEVTATGWVTRIDPATANRGRRYWIAVTQIADQDPDGWPRLIRVSASPGLAQTPPQLGDGVLVRARLTAPPGPVIPGGYDFARSAYFQRLGGVGRAVGPLEPAKVSVTGLSAFNRGVARIRQSMADQLYRGGCRGAAWIMARSPNPPPLVGVCGAAGPSSAENARAIMNVKAAGALVAAVITGDRSRSPPEAVEALRVSGLGHILAISGLHMAMVAGGAFFVLSALLAALEPLARRGDVRPWAAFGALAIGAGYLAVSGGAVSAQRAYVMAATALVAVMLRRRVISLRTVAVACVLVLLIAPESAASPGFQMSFAATLALVAAHSVWARHRRQSNAPLPEPSAIEATRSTVADLSLASVVAGAATAPFAAYHFNRWAAYGLVANLAAMPVFSFWVMPVAALAGLAALGAAVLGFIAPLAEALAALAGVGALTVIHIAMFFAESPGSVVSPPAGPAAALALVAAGMIAACGFSSGRLRIGGALATLGALIWLVTPQPHIWLGPEGRTLVRASADTAVAIPQFRGDYARDVVLRRWGIDGDELARRRADSGAITCGPLGCVITAGGAYTSVPNHAAAAEADCPHADIIVWRHPAVARPAPLSDCAAIVVSVAETPVILTKFWGRWRVETTAVSERPWRQTLSEMSTTP